ncbi:histidine phosphatase family protein [Deinococcus sp. QL22]|uniref:histidine phosphatase family protein n=1 Tax=Deinococcus sp. QL22 TaxID=2939437 RepID=UPI002018373A|nr:histidine phosphatase family protein [Deinococcus sp. QL22]UQN07448.1 histidine phosphatase family protein [Deinococcus sp. QL22]
MSQTSLPLTLYLIRHAPTLPNAQRRYPHSGEDASLSDAGRILAAGLAGTLPASPLAYLLAYTSPARRARETAALAGFPHAQAAPALQEARFGVMAGHTWAELEDEYGVAPREWIDALSDPGSDSGPPGGETGRTFHARLQKWLDALPHAGTVVAFTHAGPLLALLRLTVGLRAAEIAPGGRAVLHRAAAHPTSAGGDWWLSHLAPPTG